MHRHVLSSTLMHSMATGDRPLFDLSPCSLFQQKRRGFNGQPETRTSSSTCLLAARERNLVYQIWGLTILVPFPIWVPSPRLVPPLRRRGTATATASPGGDPPAEKCSSCSCTIARPAARAQRGWKDAKQVPAPHCMQAPYGWRQIVHTSFFRDCTVQN